MVFNIYGQITVITTVFCPILGFKKKIDMEKALLHVFKGNFHHIYITGNKKLGMVLGNHGQFTVIWFIMDNS